MAPMTFPQTSHPNDQEILSRASGEVLKILSLSGEAVVWSPLQLLRLYDNLATMFGGDEELMRHWLSTYNTHLRLVPKLAPVPEPINDYLEAFRYH